MDMDAKEFWAMVFCAKFSVQGNTAKESASKADDALKEFQNRFSETCTNCKGKGFTEDILVDNSTIKCKCKLCQSL